MAYRNTILALIEFFLVDAYSEFYLFTEIWCYTENKKSQVEVECEHLAFYAAIQESFRISN